LHSHYLFKLITFNQLKINEVIVFFIDAEALIEDFEANKSNTKE